MNPTSLVSGVITLPAHVAAAAAGTAAGIAATGVRTTARVLGWAAGRVTGPSPQQSPWAASTDVPPPASKKAPARQKAPSKKAAVMAPALGLTEAEAEDVLRTPSGIPAAGDGINPDTTETDLHQPGTEPLMDPATVKAVKSESDVLRRAADTDKG